MNFGNPRMLWLAAILVPLLAFFLWWAWRKKQSLMAQFVQSRLLANLTVGVSQRIQKIRAALAIASVALIMLALARPQWGIAWEEATQRGLDIIVALDTSRSMLAEDLAPNRLERAKLAALDLAELARTDRLGLIAFAGGAFLQCPLTLDDEAFRQSLKALDIGIIPQGGTALRGAIEEAIAAFDADSENYKALILFTDGEDHEQGVLEIAQTAADKGLRIFTVGVGSKSGELLRARDDSGALSYIKDPDGNVVQSRLNEVLLTQIATATQGFYLPLGGANAMDVLYQKGLAPLPKGEISSKLVRQFQERYQWPLALAILLLVLELILPNQRLPRGNAAPLKPVQRPQLHRAAAVFLALACLLNIASPSLASPGSARKQYQAGKYLPALQEYERLLEKDPLEPRLHFNAGSAAFQAQEFAKAADHFKSALTSPDLDLQHKAFYNQGNTWFRLGEHASDPNQTIGAWEESKKSYEAALKLNANDPDSQHNLDVVSKKLEALKKQQQQQQQQDKDSSDKNEKSDQEKNDQNQKEQQDRKDQNSPDQKQSDPKESPDKNQTPQDQPNNEQQEDKPQDSKPDPKKEGQQPDGEEEKEDQQKPSPGSKPPPKPAQSGDASTNGPPGSVLGRMTPEQVKQLLDSQKDNEKALIFLPPDKKTSKPRFFKDW